MKQFRILAALVFSMLGGSAMAQQYMIVNLQDGRMVEYRLSDVNEVKFREGARQYVDLALPSGTLWATCNLGANEPQQYGNYYPWGMTVPRTDKTQEWVFVQENEPAKLIEQGVIDENYHFTADYDAATANWGPEWRMPTDEEWQELIDNCTWEVAIIDEIRGAKVIGTNGESIFLPFSGTFFYDYDPAVGNGNYWSSTLKLNTQYNFWENSVLLIHGGNAKPVFTSCDKRWTACTVRPVRTTSKEEK